MASKFPNTARQKPTAIGGAFDERGVGFDLALLGATRSGVDLQALEPRIMLDAAGFATGVEAVEMANLQNAQSAVAIAFSGAGIAPWAPDDTSEIDVLTALTPADPVREIIFIDAAIEGRDAILAAVPSNSEIFLLDPNADGMEQIAQVLEGRESYDAIHIISHGSYGSLTLGSTILTEASMIGEHSDELTTIRAALSPYADILIYGCEFGADASGASALAKLSELTGADVAASEDLTGSAELGGDWDLEIARGNIETRVLNVQEFNGVLVAPVAVGDGPVIIVGGDKLNINIVGNDSDLDGDNLEIIFIIDPSDRGNPIAIAEADPIALISGTQIELLANGTLDVTTPLGTTDTETFEYVITDGNDEFSQALVTLDRREAALDFDFSGDNGDAVNDDSGSNSEDAKSNGDGNAGGTGGSDEVSSGTGSGTGTSSGTSGGGSSSSGASGSNTGGSNTAPSLTLDRNNDNGTLGSFDDDGLADGNFNIEFKENENAFFVVDRDVYLNDAQNNIVEVVITLTDGKVGDVFNYPSILPGGITSGVSPDLMLTEEGINTITLTAGLATTNADWNEALKSITFWPSGATPDSPDISTRHITFVASDAQGATSTVKTTTVAVALVNDLPAIDLDFDNSGGANSNNFRTSYVENADGTVIVDVDVLLSDPDNSELAFATIVLANGQAGDVLEFLDSFPESISITTDTPVELAEAGTSTITLTGPATIADFVEALKLITFRNTSETPDTTQRKITIFVNDGEANTPTQTTFVDVVSVPDPPKIQDPDDPGVDVEGGVIPDRQNFDGDVISFGEVDYGSYFFNVEEGQLTLTIAVEGLPPGLTSDANGVVTGTIAKDASLGAVAGDGIYSVTVTADNGYGSIQEILHWSVDNVKPVLVNLIDDMNLFDDKEFILDVSDKFVDPDGDTISFSANGLPPGLSIDPITGVISGHVSSTASIGGPAGDGTYSVTIIIDDSQDQVSHTSIWTAINLEPVAVGTIENVEVTEGFTFTRDVSGNFHDPDGDAIFYAATGLPDGVAIDPNTGIISGSLSYTASIGGSNGDGEYYIIVVAFDGIDQVSQSFVMTAIPAQFSIPRTPENTGSAPKVYTGYHELGVKNIGIGVGEMAGKLPELARRTAIPDRYAVGGTIEAYASLGISMGLSEVAPMISNMLRQLAQEDAELGGRGPSIYGQSAPFDHEKGDPYVGKWNARDSFTSDRVGGGDDDSEITGIVRNGSIFIDLSKFGKGKVSHWSVAMTDGTALPQWISIPVKDIILIEQVQNVDRVELTLNADLQDGSKTSLHIAIDIRTGKFTLSRDFVQVLEPSNTAVAENEILLNDKIQLMANYNSEKAKALFRV